MLSILLYKDELAAIKDRAIRSFVAACLMVAPRYIFWDAPSSSSGKYHPADELTGNGCVIHTKRVVKMILMLGGDDIAVAAGIIHDLVKQGWIKSGHSVDEHPELAVQLINKVHDSRRGLISRNTMGAIRSAVGFHMGPWRKRGRYKIPKKFSSWGLGVTARRVHLADVYASQKEIGIKIAVNLPPVHGR